MLPFLEPKKMTSTIMMRRKPSGPLEKVGEEGEVDSGLMSAAEDLISAVHSKSAKSVAEALQAAFQVCDAMPHVEGEHEEME